MIEPPFHYQFRLILIGDSTVGKSTLLRVFTDGYFNESTDPTVGVDFFSKIIEINDGIRIKMQLWDTGEFYPTNCRQWHNFNHLSNSWSFSTPSVIYTQLAKRNSGKWTDIRSTLGLERLCPWIATQRFICLSTCLQVNHQILLSQYCWRTVDLWYYQACIIWPSNGLVIRSSSSHRTF